MARFQRFHRRVLDLVRTVVPEGEAMRGRSCGSRHPARDSCHAARFYRHALTRRARTTVRS
eukprot:10129940-Lingulodinium_polyedra.AAC.1